MRFVSLDGYAGGEIDGVMLGGTPERENGPYPDTDEYTLIDEGQWHEITVDVRAVREILSGLTHPRTFRFYTHDNAAEGQEYWFDDFMILPEQALESQKLRNNNHCMASSRRVFAARRRIIIRWDTSNACHKKD